MYCCDDEIELVHAYRNSLVATTNTTELGVRGRRAMTPAEACAEGRKVKGEGRGGRKNQ
jgi:hypothetical protein